MKKVIKIFACFLILLGCEDNNNLLEDLSVRGGYAQFVEVPNLSFNILKTDTAVITADVVDPNKNITNYSLSAILNGNVVHDVVQLNSFPAKLELSLTTIFSALGITDGDLTLGTTITLVATITTPTGVYTGLSPNYDNNNVNQGGNTTVRLKSTALNDAVEFDVTFFLPPPKKVKGTSFEEVPIDNDGVYDRNGGNDETLDLINGANPPFVDFAATGDEIGFNTEYFAVPDISSSSIGFIEERIGVYSLFEDYEAYPDGNQGFHIEDADGGIRITFDTVDIPADQNQSGVSFDIYLGDTSWESRDGLYAYANIVRRSGVTETIDIVDILDDDVEAVAGQWITYNIAADGTGFLKDVASYQLVIEAKSGATPESFDIDNIIVYVPEE